MRENQPQVQHSAIFLHLSSSPLYSLFSFSILRVVIFVNGQFYAPETARQFLRHDDYIIAVNGGTHHALSIDVIPHMIIGDLDSLGSSEKARIMTGKAELLRFPRRKDETDLELALHQAKEKGATEIILFAALGGRLDQCFGNICLLTLPELEGIHIRIIDGSQEAFLLRDSARIKGNPGDTVSILPIGGDASGITNDGLEWPLTEATLPLGSTRGISNVMLEHHAHIRVRKGMLLCVVTRAKSNGQACNVT